MLFPTILLPFFLYFIEGHRRALQYIPDQGRYPTSSSFYDSMTAETSYDRLTLVSAAHHQKVLERAHFVWAEVGPQGRAGAGTGWVMVQNRDENSRVKVE